MIWVFFLLGACLGVGVVITNDYFYRNDKEVLGGVMIAAGVVFTVVTVVFSALFINKVVSLRAVDEKIKILQEENETIEQQITVIVRQYQEHEKEVFSEVSPESAIQFVSLYPELKSDTLVARQMEIYYANRETLRDLKLSKANESVYRWWLYFGGGKA